MVTTGKPQVTGTLFPASEKIGPLPNVFAAANYMLEELLGIPEGFDPSGFTVYPNPNQGIFEVVVPKESVSEIRLCDISGKEIRTGQLKTVMGFELETRGLKAGMYYLSVIYKDGITVTKTVQLMD